MDIERPSNVTLFDFVGGLQLLRNGNIRTAIPVILIGVCICGALCNLLVLLVFIRDFKKGRGSEVKALLASLACTDLLILLLCAPLMFSTLVPYSLDEVVCVSEMPVCASEFMSLFYKIYPTAVFVVPIILTLAYHTKTLHGAVNNAPNPRHQSKVTLVLLCLSGALGLMLLPEWGTFTWIRLGFNRPPVGLLIFANVLFYTCSAVFPVLLMTMYDDVRQGLVSLWYVMTCRPRKHPPTTVCKLCVKPDGNGAEACPNEVTANAKDRTFPDVEHFWTGRRNTHVEDEQDPVPWERDEKMLQSGVQSNQTEAKQECA
ncbi:hypothetical protein WMY93_016738 [Mugilogobius chulae]|uniref:G-protein coupled receptors family 1 profile domain-containing protein n=1 Tax=Mugilogobius chulae TaxID=88201 RepID=A0AAW0NT65_9GOBI